MAYILPLPYQGNLLIWGSKVHCNLQLKFRKVAGKILQTFAFWTEKPPVEIQKNLQRSPFTSYLFQPRTFHHSPFTHWLSTQKRWTLPLLTNRAYHSRKSIMLVSIAQRNAKNGKTMLCHRLYQGDGWFSFIQKENNQVQRKNLFRRV